MQIVVAKNHSDIVRLYRTIVCLTLHLN